jgi:tRNA(Ile)-lysidine synthase
MSSRSATLLTKLAAAWPPERWHDVTVLVAVSGGADSAALVRALHAIRTPGEGRLIVAHYNHRLRGAESDADQTFVEALANQLGLELLTGSAPSPLFVSPSPAQAETDTAEAALREQRYAFLAEAANQSGARYIATAHTADDQVETVLHNILRGTGLAGLAGIPRLRPLAGAATIVRPLLEVTRNEVLDYLQSIGQSFRDDSTNRLEDYTRNRIRQSLLPLLERDYNPRVRQAILRLARIAGEGGDFLNQEASELLRRAGRIAPDSLEMDAVSLQGAHPTLVRQAVMIAWEEQGWPFRDMTFERWEQLRQMIQAPECSPPVQMFPGSVRAEREGGMLRLSRLGSSRLA